MALPERRLTGAAVVAAAAVAVAAGCGGTTTVTQTVTVTRTRTVTTSAGGQTGAGSTSAAPACAAGDLDADFSVVAGSAGAGQISYELRLTNASQAGCFVSGLPDVRLLDAAGSTLPTNVSAARPGEATAARIELAPGESAYAQARFSPDVPGPGEQNAGPCEPRAAGLRVSVAGGGTLVAPVRPPTPVCEHGALSFELLSSTP